VLAMNEALISYFDSEPSAIQGRALIVEARHPRDRRPRVALLARGVDGSRSPYEAPTQAPLGAALGIVLGVLVGSFAGEAGVVVGVFFGWYAGLLADLWRSLARCDLLDRVLDGLAPGQAALVTFTRPSAAARVERSLAATDAVTVHRFPGRPIEEDVTREVREAEEEVDRLVEATDRGEVGLANGAARIAAARRRLSVLEAVSSQLLWLEQLHFESHTRILCRERRAAPRWQARRLRARMTNARAAHQRFNRALEASRERVRAAAALAENSSGPSVGGSDGAAS